MTPRRLAWSVLAGLLTLAAASAPSAQTTTVAGISPGAWRSLGPGNLAGTVSALDIDPADPNVMFANAPGGGLFRTTDGGAHWTPIDELFSQLSAGWRDNERLDLGAIERDPRDRNVIFATLGNRLARSLDAGATWALLPPVAAPLNNSHTVAALEWLAIGPDGAVWTARRNIVYRSVDRGTTFDVQQIADSGFGLTRISFSRLQTGKAVAGGQLNDTFLTNDGGATWTRVLLPGFRNTDTVSVACAPTNPAIVYAVTSQGRFWKSTDGGLSYVQSQTSLAAGAYTSVWVDPSNPEQVVIGGPQQVYRTVDGGATFSTLPLPGNAGTGIRAFVTDPGFGINNRRAYAAAREGVAVTVDLDTTTTAGWQFLNTGFSNGEIAGADGSPAAGSIVARLRYTGLIRSGSQTGPNGWSVSRRFSLLPEFFPTSETVVVDPSDPAFVYAQGNTDIGVLRSVDGGQTFASVSATSALGLALQPGDPNVLVLHASTVERSRNARAASPSFTTILPATFFGQLPLAISDFTYAPSRPETAWAARSPKTLLRSDNAGADAPTWSAMDYPGMSAGGAPLLRIVLDPASPDTVYLANATAQPDGLYRTRDGGATWTDLTGATDSATAQDVAGQLPPWQGVYDLAIHPDHATWLYAATESGVYASEDDGATWSFAGPTRARVRDLFWMGRTLVAATDGRGLSSVDLGPHSAPQMAIDSIAPGATCAQPCTVSGWAIDRGAESGSGVDVVHVYAYPPSGAPIFLGAASVGGSRPDIAAYAGARFGASGFSLVVRSLAPGPYQFVAFARSTLTGTFNNAAAVSVTIPPSAFMAIDIPADGAVVASTFRVAGWAVDLAAASGTGIDAVHVWAYPVSGATPLFLGEALLGGSRPDLGAIFGPQFTPSGYELVAQGVPFGSYVIVAFGHSTVTGTFSVSRTTTVSVEQTVRLVIDTPRPNETISQSSRGIFFVFGWAIDTAAPSGTGIDAVHVYAYPVGGQPFFLGAANYGGQRSDIAAAYGSRFGPSGYGIALHTMAPGTYDLVVFAHSTVTGGFTPAVVRITVTP
jgi:photosystem II stability/assembly factor-like uncharacterized protein